MNFIRRGLTSPSHCFWRVGPAPAEGPVDVLLVPKGRALIELLTRGMKNLTTQEIKRTTGDWLEDEIDSYAELIPAWLRTAIQQANAPRKSVKIGSSGATLDDIFEAIEAYQPIRNNDPEHFTSVVTGLIAHDKDDEGFSSIHLKVRLDDVYR